MKNLWDYCARLIQLNNKAAKGQPLTEWEVRLGAKLIEWYENDPRIKKVQ